MTSVMKAEPTNGRKPSSSTTEHVEANQERQDVFPRQEMELPRCYPHNCRGQPVFRGNPEALAFAIDACSTIVTFVGSGAFLATVSGTSQPRFDLAGYAYSQGFFISVRRPGAS